MKKIALLLIVLLFLSGCVAVNQKTDMGQSQNKVTEVTEPQEQILEIEPDQSQDRIAEMIELQKKIQDINLEISRLIKYHHDEIEKLKTEREISENKLKELYEIEKENQSQQ